MGFFEKKRRAFAVLKWTMRVVIAICLILCVYWIITFSGLYREVVLFLSDESGSYGLISSILITLIMVFLPIAVLDYFLLYLLDKIYREK